jgi:hypothetical protein
LHHLDIATPFTGKDFVGRQFLECFIRIRSRSAA